MKRPIFSVVIPTHNRPEILARTLDCLERQECGFSYEVIVVDDASTEPLPELGFGLGCRKRWNMIRLDKNLGRAAARNRGIKAARGEYVLMLDDDIWAEPQLLQAHYDKQREIGGGVVVGAVPVDEGVPRDPVNGHYRRRMERLHRIMEVEKDDLRYNFFLTGNCSVPRGLLPMVGMFDESFKGYSCEDTELGYRIKRRGTRMVFEKQAVGRHANRETLDAYLDKWVDWGRSAFVFARLHPELAREISVAGILCPGRSIYRPLLKKQLLKLARSLLRASVGIVPARMAERLLDLLCRMSYAYGLRLASEGAENKPHEDRD